MHGWGYIYVNRYGNVINRHSTGTGVIWIHTGGWKITRDTHKSGMSSLASYKGKFGTIIDLAYLLIGIWLEATIFSFNKTIGEILGITWILFSVNDQKKNCGWTAH